MPEEAQKVDDLIDVGEADQKAAEINLDDKGEPEKVEAPKEEKIEVEKVEAGEEPETKVEAPKEEKDELKEYSDGVQKRISKLTRKMREAERQREEAVTYAQAVRNQNTEMERRLSKVDSSYVSEFESRVKTSLAAAQLALKNAIESQNVEAQIAAQEQLANLTVENARLNAMKIADEEEGYDPKSDEYYEEVDTRIRVEFPHKFDKIEGQTTERAKPAQNVASANRSARTGRKKTVKLSPSQVAIAKRIGVPLEEYAKQLNITEGV